MIDITELRKYFTLNGTVYKDRDGRFVSTGTVTVNQLINNHVPPVWSKIEGNFNFGAGIVYIEDFVGCPNTILGGMRLLTTEYGSLNGLPKVIDDYIVLDSRYIRPILKLLYVENIKNITFGPFHGPWQSTAKLLDSIVNRYLHMGDRGVMPCSAELIKHGLGKYAGL